MTSQKYKERRDEILTLLRAGVDPDTKQAHISWLEAEQQINQLFLDIAMEAIKDGEVYEDQRTSITDYRRGFNNGVAVSCRAIRTRIKQLVGVEK